MNDDELRVRRDVERRAVLSSPDREFVLCPWARDDRTRYPDVVRYSDDIDAGRALIRERIPLLIQGVQDDTVASRRWSFAYLSERFGECMTPVIPLRQRMLSYDRGHGIEYVQMRLADVIASSSSDGEPDWYVSVPPGPHFHGLAEEARVPSLTHGATWRSSRIWIGSGGTMTPIHHEFTDNVLCLISGTKEFVLFAPSARARLAPCAPWSRTPHISRVDPRTPHAADATRSVEIWRCTLHAGDSLFVPRGWWHAVRTTGESIAINYWWARGMAALLPRAADHYKRLFRLST